MLSVPPSTSQAWPDRGRRCSCCQASDCCAAVRRRPARPSGCGGRARGGRCGVLVGAGRLGSVRSAGGVCGLFSQSLSGLRPRVVRLPVRWRRLWSVALASPSGVVVRWSSWSPLLLVSAGSVLLLPGRLARLWRPGRTLDLWWCSRSSGVMTVPVLRFEPRSP